MMSFVFTLSLMLQVSHQSLIQGETYYSAGRWDEAKPYYQQAVRQAPPRERAIAALRLYLIDAPRFASLKRKPPVLEASTLNALTPEDRRALEKEIYGVLRWYTVFEQFGPQLGLARYFLSSKPQSFHEGRTWYLLGLSSVKRRELEQARWYFMHAVESLTKRPDLKAQEVLDLTYLNLSRLDRVEGRYRSGLSWCQKIEQNSPWIHQASFEAMWNQFELDNWDAALATSSALALLLGDIPSREGLTIGAREMAFYSNLLSGYIHVKQNDLSKARAKYLLAMENLRYMRIAALRLRAPEDKVARVKTSSMNPFRYPSSEESPVREWLSAEKYHDLLVIYDDTLRVYRELVDKSAKSLDRSEEALKSEQARLAAEIYKLKLDDVLRKIASLSLKAQLGLEHVHWQERMNKVSLKKDLLMLKKHLTDEAQERMDEIVR